VRSRGVEFGRVVSPPQPPSTPVELAEASAPAGSDTETRCAALRPAAAAEGSRPSAPPLLPLLSAGLPGGVGVKSLAGSGSLAWHDDDFWRASAQLPRLVVRNERSGGWDTNDAAAAEGPQPALEGAAGAQDCAEWDAERQFTALRRRRADGDARGGRRRASAPPLQRHRRPGHGMLELQHASANALRLQHATLHIVAHCRCPCLGLRRVLSD
jgi:hypothetical protein